MNSLGIVDGGCIVTPTVGDMLVKVLELPATVLVGEPVKTATYLDDFHSRSASCSSGGQGEFTNAALSSSPKGHDVVPLDGGTAWDPACHIDSGVVCALPAFSDQQPECGTGRAFDIQSLMDSQQSHFAIPQGGKEQWVDGTHVVAPMP